jgi:chromosome segregation ATPase
MAQSMKNLLQNLLILFALALCVLLAIQWHREGVLRRQLESSDKTSRSVSGTVESLQSDVRRMQQEITRVEGLRRQMATNEAAREEEITQMTLELQQHAQVVAELESVKAALTKANDNIKLQNETLQKLGDERNEVVERYNQLAEEYNTLVNRWNAQQAPLTNSTRSVR